MGVAFQYQSGAGESTCRQIGVGYRYERLTVESPKMTNDKMKHEHQNMKYLYRYTTNTCA